MKRVENNDGFTLLEVIISMAIFTIAIIALYTLQAATINQNTRASRITTADTWASDKIEELISSDYDEVNDSDGDGNAGIQDTTAAAVDGSAVSPDGVYTVLWNVVEEQPLPNTKTLRVIVTSRRAGVGNLVDLEYIKHKG